MTKRTKKRQAKQLLEGSHKKGGNSKKSGMHASELRSAKVNIRLTTFLSPGFCLFTFAKTEYMTKSLTNFAYRMLDFDRCSAASLQGAFAHV